MVILAESSGKNTYRDYAKLPEGAPYQLINGEFVMTPAPTTYHQRILRRLLVSLSQYCDNQEIGEVLCAPIDVFFSETETYQPDIIYISKDRFSIIAEEKVEGPPDLIAEILSPNNAYYDLRHKKQIYEQHDVKEYWIVDPMEKSIEIYENKQKLFGLVKKYDQSEIFESPFLKGFELTLSEVF